MNLPDDASSPLNNASGTDPAANPSDDSPERTRIQELATTDPANGETGRDLANSRAPVPQEVSRTTVGDYAPPEPSQWKAEESPGPFQSTVWKAPKGESERARELPQIPGFEFLRRLGKGGMGVVWLARDLRAGRLVALKMTISDELSDLERTRFRTEAQAMARLQHPNIVGIFEVNEHEGRPYFTMSYCPCGTLIDFLNHKPQPPKVCAEILEQLALGVQHAHENGIIHRDLKPGNVLIGGEPVTADEQSFDSTKDMPSLTSEGAPRELRLTDFGLAKYADASQHITRTEAVMGTPSYMAPEQVASPKKVSGSADVWSLGVILYEMITGNVPFVGSDWMAILENVRTQDPVPPSQKVKCPRDLETICLKCLRKDPRDRYASAQALADDLRAFLEERSISARPMGSLEKGVKWVRRNPLLAGLLLTTCLAMLASLGLWIWVREVRHASELERERNELALTKADHEKSRQNEAIKAANNIAETQRVFGVMNAVRQRRAEPYPGWPSDNLKDLKSIAKSPADALDLHNLRTEAVAALMALEFEPIGVLAKGFEASMVAFSPDSKTLAAGEWRATPGFHVRLFDVATMTETCTYTFFDPELLENPLRAGTLPNGSRSMVFSPDGRWLVLGMSSGHIARFPIPSPAKTLPTIWKAHTKDGPNIQDGNVNGLSFTADGKILLSSSDRSTAVLRAWDTTTWKELWNRKGFYIHRMTYPISGKPIVENVRSGNQHPHLHELDPTTGKTTETDITVDGNCCFSPQGDLVAFANKNGWVGSRYTTEDQISLNLAKWGSNTFHRMHYISFHPSSHYFCTSEVGRRKLRFWDSASGNMLAEQNTSGGAMFPVFSPDGQLLAVSEEKEVKLYRIRPSCLRTVGLVPEVEVHFAGVTQDGKRMITASDSAQGTRLRRTQIDPVEKRESEWMIPSTRTVDFVSALSPDGNSFAFKLFGPGTDGVKLIVNDFRNGGIRLELEDLDYGADGRLWVAESRRVVTVDPKTWKTTPHLSVNSRSGMVLRGISVGKKWAVVGKRSGTLFRVDTSGKLETESWDISQESPTVVALAPEETTAIMAVEKGTIYLVQLSDGKVLKQIQAHKDNPTAVAFAPGFFVTGSRDRTIKFWTRDCQPILTMPLEKPVKSLWLSADGERLTMLLEEERALRQCLISDLRKTLQSYQIPDGFPSNEGSDPSRSGP